MELGAPTRRAAGWILTMFKFGSAVNLIPVATSVSVGVRNALSLEIRCGQDDSDAAVLRICDRPSRSRRKLPCFRVPLPTLQVLRCEVEGRPSGSLAKELTISRRNGPADGLQRLPAGLLIQQMQFYYCPILPLSRRAC